MRKLIFDLDSSYLEQKALRPGKERSKNRVMKPAKNRALVRFLRQAGASVTRN